MEGKPPKPPKANFTKEEIYQNVQAMRLVHFDKFFFSSQIRFNCPSTKKEICFPLLHSRKRKKLNYNGETPNPMLLNY